MVSSLLIDYSLFDIYFLIVLYSLLQYILYLKSWYLNEVELKKAQHIKNEVQKEKLDLIQTITKERSLSSIISTLISKLLMQNYEIRNYLVV
jgi:two-component system sensor histidine kinase ComP